jgi:type III secretion protein U
MGEDKSKKTEQPTPKRLRDARKKGQVAKSREIVSTLLLFAIFIFFGFSWPYQMERFKEMVLLPTHFYQVPFEEALKDLVELLLMEAIYLMLPLIVLIVAVGLLANLLQFGLLFAVESILPKMEKINPLSGIKRIFSARTAIEAVKSVFKIALISVLLFFVINNNLSVFINLPYRDIDCLADVLAALTGQIVVYLMPGFFVIAVTDYCLQRIQFTKDNKMTKEEVKKEYKDTEGDPLIKGQRKGLHQQFAMQDTLQTVQEASLLLTGRNVAVALWYQKEKTSLPIILVIGNKQQLAKQMIAIAQTKQVPILEDAALSQDLAEHGVAGQPIPEEFAQASANVLRQVMDLSP